MTDNQKILLILGGYFIIWILLIIIVRRNHRRTLKKINDAHKMDDTTLPDDVHIFWEELGFLDGERPYVKLH